MLTAISAALGQAWNLVGGFGGLTSFGHVAFFGFGAYGAAILQTRYGVNPWFGLPLGALLGGLCRGGHGVGGVPRRAPRQLFRAGHARHRGDVPHPGQQPRLHPCRARDCWSRCGSAWATSSSPTVGSSYGLALGPSVLLTVAAAQWVTRSRFGAQLIAVRENEDAARALGVKVLRTKVLALALSGSLTVPGRRALYPDLPLYRSQHRLRLGTQRGDAAGRDDRRCGDGDGADLSAPSRCISWRTPAGPGSTCRASRRCCTESSFC